MHRLLFAAILFVNIENDYLIASNDIIVSGAWRLRA